MSSDLQAFRQRAAHAIARADRGPAADDAALRVPTLGQDFEAGLLVGPANDLQDEVAIDSSVDETGAVIGAVGLLGSTSQA